MKKRIVSLLLAAALLTGAASAAGEEGAAEQPDLDLSAASAVLMEKETGALLYEKESHQQLEPASVTKVMTLLLIMEDLDSGRLSKEDLVTVSAAAAGMGGSQVYLKEGEQLSAGELIKCIAVVSGNDAAVAMAEHLAGSEAAFVERMNRRAQELGMKDTAFVNCTGLPAAGHHSSAYDIALMSRELILHHPDIRRFTTIWMDTLRGGSFQLSNTNKLIRFYDGATGLKTGSTDAAGFCISATAERDGMELIAVIMKGQTADKRNTDAKTLLNYGFSTYALADIAPQEPLAPVPVRLGAEDAVQPVLPSGSTLLVEKTKAGQLTQSVELPAEVEAPVAAGQALGTLTVRAGDEVLLELPLQAEQAVEKLSWGGMLTRLLRCAFLAG